MATYIVQPGDSPALIAARLAGCPKCAVDLVAANPQKRAVRYPNGFVTFDKLNSGEHLTIPAKWVSGALDRLPQSYFDGLASPDGGTLAQLTPDRPRTRPNALPMRAAVLEWERQAPLRAQTFALRGPVVSVARCHVFSATLVGVQATAADWPTALQSVIQANGIDNGFVGPGQSASDFIVSGTWMLNAPMQSSRDLVDGQGNIFQVQALTDNGPVVAKSGPCVSIINPQVVKNLGPPPPKQYNQPQGHAPQQGGEGAKNPQQGGQQPSVQQAQSNATMWWWIFGITAAGTIGTAVYLDSRKR